MMSNLARNSRSEATRMTIWWSDSIDAMQTRRTGSDFSLSAFFGNALCGENARVFGLRAITPNGGFLFAK
jgi:hypothetical protein